MMAETLIPMLVAIGPMGNFFEAPTHVTLQVSAPGFTSTRMIYILSALKLVHRQNAFYGVAQDHQRNEPLPGDVRQGKR